MSSRTAALDADPESRMAPPRGVLASPATPAARPAHEPDTAPTDAACPVVLKGTKAGLEIVIDGAASAVAIGEALTMLLSEAPSFFAGSQARVRVDGKLPAGTLGRLEDVTARFDLTIVEVGPLKPAAKEPAPIAPTRVAGPTHTLVDGIPMPNHPDLPNLADGSAPLCDDDGEDIEVEEIEPVSDGTLASARLALAAAGDELGPGARLFVGPVRSGAVLEARGHLVILGDVNPGAEVRAEGNILVLGRLRGVAHAAIGREAGFILALRLEPQQIRIGNLVARAGADDSAGEGVEIAYATGKTIVVERYQGRLPSGLAASL